MSKYNWQEIKHRADGNWPQILGSLAGVSEKQLRNKHTSCPNCGGTDRYRFDDKQGTGSYICGQCGAGDGMSLLVKCSGMSFGDCVDAVGSYLLLDPSDKQRVYVVPKKVNKIMSTRKNDFVSKELIDEYVDTNFKIANITEWTARNRIKAKTLIHIKKGDTYFLIDRAHKCSNALIVSMCGTSTKYTAGGMTNGGYHRINTDLGKSIFFCVNIIDAHLTAQFTNCECVCVFEHANMLDAIEQYKEDYKPEKPIYISVNKNETELILAESAGYMVVLPTDSEDIQTSSGFEKKAFNPTELLNNDASN